MKIRQILAGIIALSFVMAPVSYANEKASEKVNAQNEEIKQDIMKVYNQIVTLDGEAYSQFLNQAADQADVAGLEENARALREMANPELKSELVSLMKDRIDHASENGFFLIYWAFWRAFHPGWYVATPGRIMMVLFLSIITLDGDEASRY